MEILSTHIDDLIVPLFGGILAIIDTNDNLDLAFSKQQYIELAWKLIYQDENILLWNSLISERSLRSPKSFLNHSKGCLLKKNKFPFFKIIYQQVNCLYTDMVIKFGKAQNAIIRLIRKSGGCVVKCLCHSIVYNIWIITHNTFSKSVLFIALTNLVKCLLIIITCHNSDKICEFTNKSPLELQQILVDF